MIKENVVPLNAKIKKFLRLSFIGMIVICVMVFAWLTVFMSNKTEESIIDVSEIYMSEMNKQLGQKFSSIISLRMQQVEGIVRRTPPDTVSYSDEMLEELEKSVIVRNFTYFGFYTEDEELQTVYGNDITFVNNSGILEALSENKSIVKLGIDENGEKILLLGEKADYPMEDGRKSAALVVGISMEYLNDALFLDEEDAMVYSHIIESDGSYVIRNGDAYRNSYFDRIESEFDEYNGKEPGEYAAELRSAMNAGEDYSAIISEDGEKKYIYCSRLADNSTWYLVTIMSNGSLDHSIMELDTLRMAVTIGSSGIILIAMSAIFILYYKLSKRQMEELDKARHEAVHANKAKSQFLSNMSHDIRTPMNAIVGMTEIALKNVNDSMKVEDCLKKVKLSSKHLLGLINDVLDMSKIESGKMTLNLGQVSIRETMDDIVNIMQPQVKAKNQYFDIFIGSIESENVLFDSVRLNQVLLNILSNAVKFTPEGGRIDVYLYQEPSPLGDEYVRNHFRIKDTGIGMSEEFQKKIFDSFSREDTEPVQKITGTGLGMAITKFIVDLAGGTIELHSELGKGSDFHVTMDFRKSETVEEDLMLPPWNILVVDDNEQLCLSAVSNLKELGVCAEYTTDGRNSVQMIEERHNRQEDYRFVLIDWKMPHMDGMQTIREIQKSVGKEIPVFLISAYDWNDIEEEAHTAQIEGFIPKPLFKSTLYEYLNKYAEGGTDKTEKKDDEEQYITGKRILVAEDVEMNWEIADEILSSAGLLLEWAENGQICVEKFRQSEIGFYDAILMDVRMPVMNGYEATKAIRALNRPDRDLPIIAMTADAFSDDVQRCLESGMNAHTAKPLDVKKLMDLLEKYLR